MKKYLLPILLISSCTLAGCQYPSSTLDKSKTELSVEKKETTSLSKEEAHFILSQVSEIKSRINEKNTLMVDEKNGMYSAYVASKSNTLIPLDNITYQLNEQKNTLLIQDELLEREVDISAEKKTLDGYKMISKTLKESSIALLNKPVIDVDTSDESNPSLFSFTVKEGDFTYKVSFDSEKKTVSSTRPEQDISFTHIQQKLNELETVNEQVKREKIIGELKNEMKRGLSFEKIATLSDEKLLDKFKNNKRVSIRSFDNVRLITLDVKNKDIQQTPLLSFLQLKEEKPILYALTEVNMAKINGIGYLDEHTLALYGTLQDEKSSLFIQSYQTNKEAIKPIISAHELPETHKGVQIMKQGYALVFQSTSKNDISYHSKSRTFTIDGEETFSFKWNNGKFIISE